MVTHKRRKFFISREFQGKAIFNAFLSVAVGSVLFALIFSFFSSNTLSIVYENYHLKLGTTPGLLLDKIFSTQWLFIVLGGMAVAVMTLFLSHRVAGPFFRFEKTLDEMTAKDLTGRIHLRKNDEGKILGEKINRFNKMLSQNLQEMQDAAENIRQCCDAFEHAGEDKAPPDLPAAQLEKIKQHNQKNLDILGGFTLRQS